VFDKFAGVAPTTRNGLGLIIRWMAVVCSALVVANVEASAQQPFVTIEGDLKTAAWWVVADFHPSTTEVRGIPVKQIRKNWCKATEFRKDLIPKEILLEEGVDEMEVSKLSFALEGHFDGSANTQTALVGFYQECSGQKGRFIMILGTANRKSDSSTPCEPIANSARSRRATAIPSWPGPAWIVMAFRS
jgi:hypothetical protein